MSIEDIFTWVATVLLPVVLIVVVIMGIRDARKNADQANKNALTANASALKAAVAAERVEATLANTTGVVTEKLDTIHILDKEIHVLVDGRLSKALDKIDGLEALVTRLDKALNERDADAAKVEAANAETRPG